MNFFPSWSLCICFSGGVVEAIVSGISYWLWLVHYVFTSLELLIMLYRIVKWKWNIQNAWYRLSYQTRHAFCLLIAVCFWSSYAVGTRVRLHKGFYLGVKTYLDWLNERIKRGRILVPSESSAKTNSSLSISALQPNMRTFTAVLVSYIFCA